MSTRDDEHSGDARDEDEALPADERPFVRPWEDPDTAEQLLSAEPSKPLLEPTGSPFVKHGRDSPSAEDPPGRDPSGGSGAELETAPEVDVSKTSAEEGREKARPGRSQESDLSELGDAPSSLDEFSHDDYMATTTSEYRGLAEEVARAGEEVYEQQAVAASMPGVGSGLIGFEDVTGRKGVSEEEVEAEEQRRTSDLSLRVGSAVVLIGLFLGCLLLGGVWFTGLVTLVMVVSLGEFYATLRTRNYAPAAFFGFLGLLGVAIGAHRSGAASIGGVLIATVAVVSLFYSVVVRRRPLENASLTVFGLAWVSLLAFAIIIGRSDNAVPLILLLVAVAALFDVGAFFIGRTFGRRLLAPKVSPQKTVEGLIGGVVVAFGVAAVASTLPLFDPLDLPGALALAALVSVLAPLGDAAESVLKRALAVKDMGSILPGHGGMLDRIDALLFVVPAAYFLYRALDYL